MDSIKALSINQPYAHLIVTPQDELPAGIMQKRVENRTWRTSYRGPLLIHAGKSHQKMRQWPTAMRDFPEMAFGALIGHTNLINVMSIWSIVAGCLPIDLLWVQAHCHTEGPWCFVLDNVVRFEDPIPYRGRQGLFDVPTNIVPTGGE